MQKLLAFGIAAMLIAGCSAPKYTYYFDHYDYNSGKPRVANEVSPDEAPVFGPIEIDMMVASSDTDLMLSPSQKQVVDKEDQRARAAVEEVKERYNAMSKSEKRSFRKSVKQEMRAFMKSKKSGDTALSPDAATEMDRDLKMAIIFGAVGLTLSLFSGINAAFWVLGVIAIVVGVVFLIRWLIRQ